MTIGDKFTVLSLTTLQFIAYLQKSENTIKFFKIDTKHQRDLHRQRFWQIWPLKEVNMLNWSNESKMKLFGLQANANANVGMCVFSPDAGQSRREDTWR